MIARIFIITQLFTFCASSLPAQSFELRQNIEKIIASKKANVGVSIYSIGNKDTLSINGDAHFPLQSVFKFHIALAVLHEVDKGKLSLSQNIFIKKSDLLPDTWSPIREKYPNGNVSLPLSEILKYTVAQSDNNGCDILLRLIGGTETVNNFIHSIGIKDVSIKATEEEMHKAWDVQFSNWTTTKAATQLLHKFYRGEILSKKSFNYLWNVMAQTSTGAARIKGQLPKGTIVAHKTGTSDTNREGVTAAVNDIGIVKLPNGTYFIISVFVSNSKENETVNDKIIADITKVTWDYFIKKA